jgi:hypothetical protein
MSAEELNREEEVTEEDVAYYQMQIEEWKDEYYGAVYITEIEDQTFIWRGLTKGEFKKANEYYEDPYDRAEYVCRKCVLHPDIDDWSIDMWAGIPETLTENILRESGFTLTSKEIDTKIAGYEYQMQTFDNQIACVIKEAFHDITLEEIDEWQFEKILWYYARAKWTLENLRGVQLEREEATPGMPPMPAR